MILPNRSALHATLETHVTHDVLIVGGGLAGSLAAWRLATTRHQLQLAVVESGPTLGGCHTWSFHDTDLGEDVRRWIAPLIVARWPRHEVRFPGGTRRLAGAYASITSDRLHGVIAPVLGDRLRLDSPVEHVTPAHVTLRSGETLTARLVIDSRGACHMDMPFGWQTFLGQDFELETAHAMEWPVLMDATVPQSGGFRFMYLLPWSATRVLVEDTLYADDPSIDAADRRQRIADYVRVRGWRVRQVVREERGALPIPLAGRGEAFWPDRTARIGTRAGLFHPTTGYSLPDAAATADLLTRLDLDDPDGVYHALHARALRAWRDRTFFRLLNRLLFRAAAPESRIRVLEQFYRRPEALIARFYAARLSWFDQCRLLAGRPPVPLVKALAHWRGHAS
jgi:lycopene beta-cyclase